MHYTKFLALFRSPLCTGACDYVNKSKYELEIILWAFVYMVGAQCGIVYNVLYIVCKHMRLLTLMIC